MNQVNLNLARNCIKYLIRAYGIKEIFIPYYTCETVWQAIREENCKVKFYHIDENFMPIIKFNLDDYIIYINYFGLCTKNCEKLSYIYKNLIIDNSQAFYCKHIGLASFNSLRKFFNVQNGAFLYSPITIDTKFNTDKLQLNLCTMQNNYEQFVKNENILSREKEIKLISPNVILQLNKINFEQDKELRRKIYQIYYAKLDKHNKIHLSLDAIDIPYCYPFCPSNTDIKLKILNKNIPTLKLWKKIPEIFPEYNILNDVTALPLNEYHNKLIEDC